MIRPEDFEAFGRRVAALEGEALARARVREKVERRLREGSALRTPSRVTWLVAAGAMSMAGVLLLLSWREGARIPADRRQPRTLAAPLDAERSFRLGAGRTIALSRGARAELSEDGEKTETITVLEGRVVVEAGEAERPFQVGAGPFALALTGRRFEVAWIPATSSLWLDARDVVGQLRGGALVTPVIVTRGAIVRVHARSARAELVEPAGPALGHRAAPDVVETAAQALNEEPSAAGQDDFPGLEPGQTYFVPVDAFDESRPRDGRAPRLRRALSGPSRRRRRPRSGSGRTGAPGWWPRRWGSSSWTPRAGCASRIPAAGR